ncbi:MAG: winged helix-turn-helix domain-containing protein [bacterium]
MLCNNCIMELANTVSKEGQMILNAIIKQGKINKKKIQKETKLSYAITSKAINELENKLFITYEYQGRSKVYWLTRIGGRLIMLMNKTEKGVI